MKKYIIYLLALVFDITIVVLCTHFLGLNPIFWIGMVLWIDYIISILIARICYKIPLGIIVQNKKMLIILGVICAIFILSCGVEIYKKHTNFQKVIPTEQVVETSTDVVLEVANS